MEDVSGGCEITGTAEGVRTYAVGCFVVLSDTLASVTDELSRMSMDCCCDQCSAIALQHRCASRLSIVLQPRPSSLGLSNRIGPSAPC